MLSFMLFLSGHLLQAITSTSKIAFVLYEQQWKTKLKLLGKFYFWSHSYSFMSCALLMKNTGSLKREHLKFVRKLQGKEYIEKNEVFLKLKINKNSELFYSLSLFFSLKFFGNQCFRRFFFFSSNSEYTYTGKQIAKEHYLGIDTQQHCVAKL